MRKALAGLFAATLLTVTMAGTTVAADPFVNGSFENGAYGGGSFVALPNGSEAITGWKVGGGGIDWKGTYWPAPNRTKSIDLNASGTQQHPGGSIGQIFDTVVNDTYGVQFLFSGHPVTNSHDCPAVPNLPQSRIKIVEVTATGGSPRTYQFDTTGLTDADLTRMVWEEKDYSFTATSGGTTLKFESLSYGNCGPAIDHVRITTAHVATAKDCKKGGWKSMVDANGTPFDNSGKCLKFYK
jgi:choice-of-anchor C domain-containing protein